MTDDKKRYKLWDFSDHRMQSLVFKVTEMCNLGCDYCYRKGIKRLNRMISFDTIRNSIKKYAEWIDNHFNKEKPLYLIWHGGEPLVCGKKYYKKIFEIEKSYKDEGYVIFNAFQTNGTLIDQEWVDLFKENDVLVGISIDGPKYVHDVHRMHANGMSSFNETMRGINILAENNYSYSAISVVTNETVHMLNESLEFFVNNGFSVVDFIPSFLHNSVITLNSVLYAEAMIHLFDYWKSTCYEKIYIRFLGDIEGKIRQNVTTVGCELAGYCGENFSINVEGDIYPCECVSTFGELCIGNINNENFDKMFSGKYFSKWKRLVNVIDDHCLDACSSFDICKGGCFNRRYYGDSKVMDRDPFCSPRYRIINHIKDSMRVL